MRVEQSTDGTYIKRMTDVEQKMLKMIYKEQTDRQTGDQNLQNIITENQANILQVSTDVSSVKLKIASLQSEADQNAQNILNLQLAVTQLQTQLKAAGVLA